MALLWIIKTITTKRYFSNMTCHITRDYDVSEQMLDVCQLCGALIFFKLNKKKTTLFCT